MAYPRKVVPAVAWSRYFIREESKDGSSADEGKARQR